MKEKRPIPYADVAPEATQVLSAMGSTRGTPPGERVEAALATALELLAAQAAPLGIWADLDREAFAEVYRGEGRNEPETPLEEVFPRAEQLALYAVTLGPAVSAKITDLFAANEFALATILDAAASQAAEKTAAAVERRFGEWLGEQGLRTAQTRLLRYSPGYCGWHISGQRALFAQLGPEEIGISLSASFLMEPLKSVSGVIVAGPAAVHDFSNRYPFCRQCAGAECRVRIEGLKG